MTEHLSPADAAAPRPTRRRRRLALVGVTTVIGVLALVFGLALSGGSAGSPEEGPSPSAGVGRDRPAATTSTTEIDSTKTYASTAPSTKARTTGVRRTGSGSGHSTTPGPGHLDATPKVITLPDGVYEGKVTLSNTGGTGLDWHGTVTAIGSTVSMTPESGNLPPGTEVEVQFKLESHFGTGPFDFDLHFDSEAGNQTVSVDGVVLSPPWIQLPAMNYPVPLGQTTMAIPVENKGDVPAPVQVSGDGVALSWTDTLVPAHSVMNLSVTLCDRPFVPPPVPVMPVVRKLDVTLPDWQGEVTLTVVFLVPPGPPMPGCS